MCISCNTESSIILSETLPSSTKIMPTINVPSLLLFAVMTGSELMLPEFMINVQPVVTVCVGELFGYRNSLRRKLAAKLRRGLTRSIFQREST